MTFPHCPTMDCTERTAHILSPCLMAIKGQATQDDGKSSPSGLIKKENVKKQEDEGCGPSSTSV